MAEHTGIDEENTGHPQWVDVREPNEFLRERIPGTLLIPLSRLSSHVTELKKTRPIVLVCTKGERSLKASTYLQKAGFTNIEILEGGIEAWKACGKPLIRGSSRIWGLERQVRFCVGVGILGGIGLSLLASPHWIWLSALVGAGLTFSAVTNTCGLAILLSKMPWNQVAAKTCTQS